MSMEAPDNLFDPECISDEDKAAFRAWAHYQLDELINIREQFQSDQKGTHPNSEAHNGQLALWLYGRGVEFAFQMISREAILKTRRNFPKESAVGARDALRHMLNKISPLWPEHHSATQTFNAEASAVRIDALCEALTMLDNGQVPPIFRPRVAHTGHEFERKRWQLVGALFSIHLRATGQVKTFIEADEKVAEAFGRNSERDIARTVANWRKWLIGLSKSFTPFFPTDAGIQPINIQLALHHVQQPRDDYYTDEMVANLITIYSFGYTRPGFKSLTEAGAAYQAWRDEIDLAQPQGRKRGQR